MLFSSFEDYIPSSSVFLKSNIFWTIFLNSFFTSSSCPYMLSYQHSVDVLFTKFWANGEICDAQKTTSVGHINMNLRSLFYIFSLVKKLIIN